MRFHEYDARAIKAHDAPHEICMGGSKGALMQRNVGELEPKNYKIITFLSGILANSGFLPGDIFLAPA